MSDSRELFDKANALLGRYRGDPARAGDADFPVLTDVVESPLEAQIRSPSPGTAGLDGPITEEELRALESQLKLNLEASLSLLSAKALEERLYERLEGRLRRLLQESIEETRLEIEARLRDEVSEAIRAALAALRPRDRT